MVTKIPILVFSFVLSCIDSPATLSSSAGQVSCSKGVYAGSILTKFFPKEKGKLLHSQDTCQKPKISPYFVGDLSYASKLPTKGIAKRRSPARACVSNDRLLDGSGFTSSCPNTRVSSKGPKEHDHLSPPHQLINGGGKQCMIQYIDTSSEYCVQIYFEYLGQSNLNNCLVAVPWPALDAGTVPVGIARELTRSSIKSAWQMGNDIEEECVW